MNYSYLINSGSLWIYQEGFKSLKSCISDMKDFVNFSKDSVYIKKTFSDGHSTSWKMYSANPFVYWVVAPSQEYLDRKVGECLYA